jgi:hypothetical protein
MTAWKFVHTKRDYEKITWKNIRAAGLHYVDPRHWLYQIWVLLLWLMHCIQTTVVWHFGVILTGINSVKIRHSLRHSQHTQFNLKYAHFLMHPPSSQGFVNKYIPFCHWLPIMTANYEKMRSPLHIWIVISYWVSWRCIGTSSQRSNSRYFPNGLNINIEFCAQNWIVQH